MEVSPAAHHTLQSLITKSVQQDPMREIITDVQSFCTSPLYLVGGYLYRTLVYELFGTEKAGTADIDFIVGYFDIAKIPNHYKVHMNSYGNPKLKKDDVSIDVWRLSEHSNFLLCGRKPSIENYLDLVPITTQSFAYELSTGNLMGEKGMQSILTKTIAINNKLTYDHYHLVRKKSGSISPDYDKLTLLARELGFCIVKRENV